MNAGAVGDVNTARKLAKTFKLDGQYVDGSKDVSLGNWNPRLHGWASCAYDPLFCTADSLLLEGYLFVTAITIPQDLTPISTLIVNITDPGVGLTAGQCKAALFQDQDSDGDFDLLGVTADQSTSWATAGVKSMSLISPATGLGKIAYMGLWYRGTTSPKFGCRVMSPANNFNPLIAGFTRFGVDPTGGLTTTAPATLTTINGYNAAIWGAVA